jgi:hypothetical protein
MLYLKQNTTILDWSKFGIEQGAKATRGILEQISTAEKTLLADVTAKNPDASYIELLHLCKVCRRSACCIWCMLHRVCSALPHQTRTWLPALHKDCTQPAVGERRKGGRGLPICKTIDVRFIACCELLPFFSCFLFRARKARTSTRWLLHAVSCMFSAARFLLHVVGELVVPSADSCARVHVPLCGGGMVSAACRWLSVEYH